MVKPYFESESITLQLLIYGIICFILQDQYAFCYQAALEHLASFDHYQILYSLQRQHKQGAYVNKGNITSKITSPIDFQNPETKFVLIWRIHSIIFMQSFIFDVPQFIYRNCFSHFQ